MIRFLQQCITLITLLSIGLCFAQEPTQPARMPFYSAQKGALTLFVFGTMHIGMKQDYPARAEIIDALSQSQILALELDAVEAGKAQALSQTILCSTDCLYDYFTEQEQEDIKEFLSNYPQTIRKAITRTSPIVAGSIVSLVDGATLGFNLNYGSEQYLTQLAGDNKTIISLETAQQQIDLLTKMPLPIQNKFFLQLLQFSKAERLVMLETLHQLWRAGDANKLYTWYIAHSVKHTHPDDYMLFSQLNDAILYKRNQYFVDKSIQLLQEDQPVFIAVGALHLGGSKGILALLRERGFNVVRR